MAGETQIVWTVVSAVAAALGVGVAVTSISRWARGSRRSERLDGSPFTSALGGCVLAAAGSLAALFSLLGLASWVVALILAVGAALAAALCGVDRTVGWLRSTEAAIEPPARSAERVGVARTHDERVEDEL